jgi:hypothetical protein
MEDFARRLETEGLLVLEETFTLSLEENARLAGEPGDGRAKNISRAPGAAVRGAAAGADEAGALAALLGRYADWAREVIVTRAPRYAAGLETGRTSYRPRAIDDAPISARKDDRRLHVDAFASRPTGGRRILRVFTNIDDGGRPRVWRVGEPFEAFARRFAARARRPLPGESWALQALRITRRRRTAYDWTMLAMHDAAKLDADYQRQAPFKEIAFPAGTSWIVYTDQVPHAAMAGHRALEQTFYLPLESMVAPETAPARILERVTGRAMA